MTVVDSILVGITMPEDPSLATLVIARKTKGDVPDIINAIQGEKAVELYRALVGGEKESGGSE